MHKNTYNSDKTTKKVIKWTQKFVANVKENNIKK